MAAVPVVIVPVWSSPVTVGLPVPHDDRAGVYPLVNRCPSLSYPPIRVFVVVATSNASPLAEFDWIERRAAGDVDPIPTFPVVSKRITSAGVTDPIGTVPNVMKEPSAVDVKFSAAIILMADEFALVLNKPDDVYPDPTILTRPLPFIACVGDASDPFALLPRRVLIWVFEYSSMVIPPEFGDGSSAAMYRPAPVAVVVPMSTFPFELTAPTGKLNWFVTLRLVVEAFVAKVKLLFGST